MTDKQQLLTKYLPNDAVPIISRWISDTGCVFKISRSRRSKFGDYRAPYQGATHRITINQDLNKYAFLITTVHEFAHLKTWKEFKGRVKPHGIEWKTNFQLLMEPFFKLGIFPEDIAIALLRYMKNPAASSCTDINLYRILKQHNFLSPTLDTIDTLPDNSYFQIRNGRTFQKLEKLRKRFKCREIPSGKLYLFSPIAEVIPLGDSEQTPTTQHILIK